MIDIKNSIEKFKEYTDKYLLKNKKHKLKVDHTYRVMELCEKIAKSLNLSEEEVSLAKVCGLLHDIARFEQLDIFETFADSKSIDHGDLGYYILKKDNFIDMFNDNKKFNSIILNSVKYHNKLSIPNNLSKEEALYTKIVRDADKLDILYLITTDDIKIDIQDDLISDNVLNSILNNKTINKTEVKTNADRICVWFGFLFFINFDYSIKYLKETKYFNIIIRNYILKSSNENTKKQLETIENHLDNYILKKEGKLC